MVLCSGKLKIIRLRRTKQMAWLYREAARLRQLVLQCSRGNELQLAGTCNRATQGSKQQETCSRPSWGRGPSHLTYQACWVCNSICITEKPSWTRVSTAEHFPSLAEARSQSSTWLHNNLSYSNTECRQVAGTNVTKSTLRISTTSFSWEIQLYKSTIFSFTNSVRLYSAALVFGEHANPLDTVRMWRD